MRGAQSSREAGSQAAILNYVGDNAMKPRITLITLSVDNLEAALAFYRDGLGFSTEGIIGTEF